MGRNKVNWGLCVSMLLHILLMAVPMTITGILEFKEIELFVMEEKPEVREERFMESAKTASISRTIKPVVIKDPNTLPVSPSVEEKKVENETGIEPQKGEMETALKERSEPFSQPPLTSILEAERKEEEIKELARLKEEEARRALAEKQLAAERERLAKPANTGQKDATGESRKEVSEPVRLPAGIERVPLID
ncbi:MAG: hypothetical protein ACPL6D_16800, partial [Thermodesulfobacteriota bacterium]